MAGEGPDPVVLLDAAPRSGIVPILLWQRLQFSRPTECRPRPGGLSSVLAKPLRSAGLRRSHPVPLLDHQFVHAGPLLTMSAKA